MGCGEIVEEWIPYEQPELRCGDHDLFDGSLVECERCIHIEREALRARIEYMETYFRLSTRRSRRSQPLTDPSVIKAKVDACVPYSVIDAGWVRTFFVEWV